VVPKHRRSETEPWLASAGARVHTAEVWPEAVGYGQVAATPGRAAGQSWREWEDWQDWGPPPELHPDHPSAPVPRVQFPPDHPSAPMPRVQLPADHRSGPRSAPGAPPQTPDAGYDDGYRRLYVVRGDAPAANYDLAGPDWPGPGPAAGRFQNGGSPNRDPLWAAGQVLTLADDRAAQIAQEAREYAAAIREAAERQATAITEQATGHAAAIREAAQREAVELLAKLDSMSGELRRVAAHVTESLAAPATLAPAPALPGAAPAPPVTRPAMPVTRPARPDARPGTRPTGPVKPGTTPAKKPQKRSRQQQAMRIATAATAALFTVAAISGATEVGLHGFKFFVFRAGGTGETAGKETDQQFLAREAAAAHHVVAPKGRHHKKAHQTHEVHH
jgi:hypothetical protein